MTNQISKIIKSLLVLLIIVSQFILPINALADELEQSNENQEEISEELESIDEELIEIEQTEINNYKVLINEEELTEDSFNIEENSIKQIKIRSEYTGEATYIFKPSEIIEIDFTNRLYGKYLYELSVSNELEILDTKNITINHIGDNNEIINTNNIYYRNNTYYILGNLNKELTVDDILNQFNNNLDIYNATIEVLDSENNKLLDTDIVLDNYKLHLKATYTDYGITNEINEYYAINIVEDINEDEVIDNKDIQKLLLENILNEETEEETATTNIIDITNILLSDIKEESIDNLTTTFEYNSNIFLTDGVILKYYIAGFSEDVLKGIEGNIIYDKNILELTNIEINSIDGSYNANGHFIYLLDDYKEDGLLLTFKFKPLSIGSTTIVLKDIVGATGAKVSANIDTDSFESEINILEYGKGGDVEPEEETPEREVTEEVEEKKEVTTIYRPVTPTIKPVLLSGDNYIKSLTIKGHDLKFNKDILEYELYVKNNIKSLDLNIELNDNNATYEVFGNESFKSGENIIKIVVTAENDNQKTYTIKVNKESKEVIEEELETTSNASKAVIIFLIILVIIGLVYVIFKDDEEDEK